MNIEDLRTYCMSLPGVTEDIKWEDNLVFSVGNKMFCLADLKPPLRVSLKVPEAQFTELTQSEAIIQAPYFARLKWVTVIQEEHWSKNEWEFFLQQSYSIVKSGMSKKKQQEIDAITR
jgi:predicted DNA-binding protein (MmcQ/YjbR family)